MHSGKFKLAPIERILATVERNYGITDLDDGDVIEWTGEALEGIGAVPQYEEGVAIIEVVNHQCSVPNNFHAIIQIARNNCFVEGNKEGTGLCAKTVIESNPLDTPPPSIPVVLDCNGQPLQEYELAYYRPYFDLQYFFPKWKSCGIYQGCFSPVRLSTSSFSALMCKEQDESPYQSCRDEYSVVGGEVLRFSFERGQVAVAYLRQPVDENGYPMIPDDYSYIKAIASYVVMMKSTREFYAGREGAKAKMDKAESDWQWYCKQSGNKALMPKGIDEYQNLLDQRQYLIPRMGEYYGFFGRLAQPEMRRYNNPGRNRKRMF